MTVAAILLGPAHYQLSNNSVLIWWVTDLGSGPNKIQWWKPATSTTDVAAITTQVADIETGATRFVHRVSLTGLTKGVTHSYKIFAENFETPTVSAYTFTTFNDDGSNVKVGVWGSNDQRYGTGIPGLGGTLTFLDTQNVDTYMTTGGLVADGRKYQSWDDTLTAIGIDRLQTGFAGARGTSDGFGTLAQAMYPFAGGNQTYWSFQMGVASFASLTSVEGVPRRNLKIGKDQSNWLLNQLSKSANWRDASYRVLLVHDPFRTTFWDDSCQYGTNGTRRDLEDLQTLVKLSGTDVVLYGSSRSYQRGAFVSSMLNNSHTIHHIVTGGGGGFKHSQRCFSWPPPQEPSILKDTDDYVALTLDISSSRLLIEAHNMESSTVFDSVNIAPHSLYSS